MFASEENNQEAIVEFNRSHCPCKNLIAIKLKRYVTRNTYR